MLRHRAIYFIGTEEIVNGARSGHSKPGAVTSPESKRAVLDLGGGGDSSGGGARTAALTETGEQQQQQQQ